MVKRNFGLPYFRKQIIFWISARLEATNPCFLGRGKSALTTKPSGSEKLLEKLKTFGGTILDSSGVSNKPGPAQVGAISKAQK